MCQKGLQNLIPSFAYIGQNTLACKILGIFTVRFFRYTASMILCPSEQMDKNGQHGCFTPSILSIVICNFVRYKIPLQKAHVICKIINVQNDAKLAHTNVRAIKSTVGYSERSSILTASEKHPPYKVFDYSVKICFARYHTPLKNFMDNL